MPSNLIGPTTPDGAYGKLYGLLGPGTVSSNVNASTSTPGPGSQVFYVNSALATASDAAGSNGGDPLRPFKTLNFAIGRCIANNGDVIYVGPQHVETITSATSLLLNVAGVTIIGLGNEVDRPTCNFTNTAGKIVVSAANVTMAGFLFTNSIDALVTGMSVTGADFTLRDCEWRDGAAKNTLIQILTTSAAKRLRILDYYYYEDQTGGGTTKTEAIRIVGGDNHVLQNVSITGTFSTGVINNITTAFVNILVKWCYLNNLSAGPNPAMSILTSSTGALLGTTLVIASGVHAITAAHVLAADMASGQCVPGATPTVIGHA